MEHLTIDKTLDKSLLTWIEKYQLPISILGPNIIRVEEVGIFIHIKAKEDKLFDKKFNLTLSNNELEAIKKYKPTHYLFEFGGLFYYSSMGTEEHIQFNLFKHLGKLKQEIYIEDYPFLGIHGKYELLSGSRDYLDWITKAKFLEIKTLGICEKNTLAGTLKFQLDCKSQAIKSILGATYSIKVKDKLFDCKFYVLNKIGWKNLLALNKKVNVDRKEKYIEEPELVSYGEGLAFIINSEYPLTETKILAFKQIFDLVFYQIDTVEYKNDKKDMDYLLALKHYFNHFSSQLEPILINDAYYLDKEDAYIRKKLKEIGKEGHYNEAESQHFKSLDENFVIFDSLFPDKDKFFDFLDKAISNAALLNHLSQFLIDTVHFNLPNFDKSTLGGEYLQLESNEDLFYYLLEKGFKTKFKGTDKEAEIWYNRLDKEIEIIKKGEFIDYFLILWDIIRYCDENNILVGVGRGSAGGSLVSYLLGIIKLNPLDYGLLFERFLNEGRIGKSLPDIDLDFEGERREDIKRYMESKYGEDYVCSVGTYTTFQIKQALKDLSRNAGVEFSKVNFITTILRDFEDDWKDLFRNAVINGAVKNFLKEHVEIVNDIHLILGQPKSASIHACATLILPKIDSTKEYKDIYSWIPVRKEENVLVSEWEGTELSDAGFLKEDILGLKMLDKFKAILNLIEKTTGDKIDIYNLPLNDEKVLALFRKGYNSDIFHFGSEGLKKMSREIQPNDINELIAMIALIRPGGLQSGANEDYVEIKFGRKKPEYDFGLKEVTKETYGLYIYQEQVMQAVQVLGDFTLAEADDIRKAMGRMKQELLDSYKDQFINSAHRKGCSIDEAEKIWDKLRRFASYGFNKSHAAAYTLMGYIGQWLKVYYPMQFWTIAFQFRKDDDQIPLFLSEMRRINPEIKIASIDINFSKDYFFMDFENKTMYWSLLGIKGLGPVAAASLMEDFNNHGQYFSFEEFYKRMVDNDVKVTKRIVENLIIAGAFDKLEELTSPTERYKLLQQYYDIAIIPKESLKDIVDLAQINKIYYWQLKQKEVSGLSHIDYNLVLEDIALFKGLKTELIDPLHFKKRKNSGKDVILAGVVVDIIERSSKTKGPFAELTINTNEELTIAYLWWQEIFPKYKEMALNALGKVIFISGKITYNDFQLQMVLQTDKYSKLTIL